MIATVKTSMRERLIEAAMQLFYASGLRAVSVDKVIEAASTTKVTFYRHFKGKDDLVVAYLERRAAIEREGIGAAVAHGGGDPQAVMRLISEALAVITCEPGFRGCPFINAAAEYPDPDSSVRKAVAEHRRWCKDAFADLVAPSPPTPPPRPTTSCSCATAPWSPATSTPPKPWPPPSSAPPPPSSTASSGIDPGRGTWAGTPCVLS
nr:hypothetical protein GCM10025732_25890 [Glycomyces mayteni]